MGDVKDILGVPREGPPPAAKSKKADAPKLVKPKGMSRQAAVRTKEDNGEAVSSPSHPTFVSTKRTVPVHPAPMSTCREAFALLSGSHPLMPSQLMGDIRKKEGVAGLKEKARRDPRGVVTFEVRPGRPRCACDGRRCRSRGSPTHQCAIELPLHHAKFAAVFVGRVTPRCLLMVARVVACTIYLPRLLPSSCSGVNSRTPRAATVWSWSTGSSASATHKGG